MYIWWGRQNPFRITDLFCIREVYSICVADKSSQNTKEERKREREKKPARSNLSLQNIWVLWNHLVQSKVLTFTVLGNENLAGLGIVLVASTN